MKQKPIRSPRHLAFIRKLDCCIKKDGLNCNGSPVHAHHLTIVKGSRGKGQKASDEYTVPLCPLHHHTLHQMGEKSFWGVWGIDAILLSKLLWDKNETSL